jgi:hypothetical protein
MLISPLQENPYKFTIPHHYILHISFLPVSFIAPALLHATNPLCALVGLAFAGSTYSSCCTRIALLRLPTLPPFVNGASEPSASPLLLLHKYLLRAKTHYLMLLIQFREYDRRFPFLRIYFMTRFFFTLDTSFFVLYFLDT